MNSLDFDLKSIVPIILFWGASISLVVLIGMICNSKFNKSVGRVSVDATLVFANPTSNPTSTPTIWR